MLIQKGCSSASLRQATLKTGPIAALNADVNLYLADDLLVKMDRATMAHSLEARSPFLDHVLDGIRGHPAV